MVKIKKIKSEDTYVYPATIAQAVKDANMIRNGIAMTQSDINAECVYWEDDEQSIEDLDATYLNRISNVENYVTTLKKEIDDLPTDSETQTGVKIAKNTADIAELEQKVGGEWSNWQWKATDGYISTSLEFVQLSKMHTSIPVFVSKGSVVEISGGSTGVSNIVKTDVSCSFYENKGSFTNGTSRSTISWTADEDCYIIVSGRYENNSYPSTVMSAKLVYPSVFATQSELANTDERLLGMQNDISNFANSLAYSENTGYGIGNGQVYGTVGNLIQQSTSTSWKHCKIDANNNVSHVNVYIKKVDDVSSYVQYVDANDTVIKLDIIKGDIDVSLDYIRYELDFPGGATSVYVSSYIKQPKIYSLCEDVSASETDNYMQGLVYMGENPDSYEYGQSYGTKGSKITFSSSQSWIHTKINIDDNVHYVRIHTKNQNDVSSYIQYVGVNDTIVGLDMVMGSIELNSVVKYKLNFPYGALAVYISSFNDIPKIYKLHEIDSALQSQNDTVIPSVLENATKDAYKRLCQWNSGKDKIVFPLINDIHAGYDMTRMSIIDYVCDYSDRLFKYDFIANLGDIGIDEAYNNSGVDAVYNILIDTNMMYKDKPCIFAKGNHETYNINNAGFTLELIKEYTQARFVKHGIVTANGRMYGYYDCEGIRIVFMDTNDNGDNLSGYEGYSNEQLGWLNTMLSEYKGDVLILQHIFPHYKGLWKKDNYSRDPEESDFFGRLIGHDTFVSMLISYNSRTSGATSASAETSAGISQSWNFSNVSGKIIGVLTGDSHFDYEITDDDINLVVRRGMGDIESNALPSWGKKSDKNGNPYIYDVVAICKDTKTVKVFRVGAGNESDDVEINY